MNEIEELRKRVDDLEKEVFVTRGYIRRLKEQSELKSTIITVLVGVLSFLSAYSTFFLLGWNLELLLLKPMQLKMHRFPYAFAFSYKECNQSMSVLERNNF